MLLKPAAEALVGYNLTELTILSIEWHSSTTSPSPLSAQNLCRRSPRSNPIVNSLRLFCSFIRRRAYPSAHAQALFAFSSNLVRPPPPIYERTCANSTRFPHGSAKKARRRLISGTSKGSPTVVTPRRRSSASVSSTLATSRQKW
jgi:hypothetical protein